MADEVKDAPSAADSFQKLVDSTKNLNNQVVKAAEDIVKVFSPTLAETLIKLDKNFKGFYVNLFKNVVGNFRRTGTSTEE
ncbi:MAG: hypothetical protein HXX08_05505 [Chloroflexi bacterium]|uniref:Uncharacterized protein n=1 Tax=Candidatus Chlorohelix allophototropha TaxID=3003348 RepID=A0A8T7LTF8_9CHLR|nr:hypothetical protein [Chloroflexota bacterium]WJW67193.1 hypothetical protein OZ401_000449 [Chloroflexota bacterium L227-S17]